MLPFLHLPVTTLLPPSPASQPASQLCVSFSSPVSHKSLSPFSPTSTAGLGEGWALDKVTQPETTVPTMAHE